MAHDPSLTKPKLSTDDNPPAGPPWRWTSAVAVTTAVMAALASIGSVLTGYHTDAAMIEQVRTSDQWNYYQAKSIKASILESKMELLPALGKEVAPEDRANAERYEREKAEIKTSAETTQASAKDHQRRRTVMAVSVSIFQVSIALCAIALLTRRAWFWSISIGIAMLGIGVGLYGSL
jgi:hypothetical protein